MPLIFQKVSRDSRLPTQSRNVGYLVVDNWDDFGHKTLFSLTVFDEQGGERVLGNIKIGFVGQSQGWTEEHVPQQFDVLPEHFYSLGQDADYYRNIMESLSQEVADNVLAALGDVVYDSSRLQIAENERAFNTSLLRSVNRLSIDHQFRRILRHEAPLTAYNFFYEKVAGERYSGIRLEFAVEPSSKPSSNIHILIGRNGVGKTTLLNNMVDALIPGRGAVEETGYFAISSPWARAVALGGNYFAGVVSVSFSAFDHFIPPDDQPDANAGMRYHYVGLKKRITQQGQDLWGLKDKNDLCCDFTNSLNVCFALTAKRGRWINAVKKLESDFNFAEMDLCQLSNLYAADLSENKAQFLDMAAILFKRMSSGHAVVLLLTRQSNTQSKWHNAPTHAGSRQLPAPGFWPTSS